MARTKLTPTRIREAVLPDGKTQDFLWDTEVKNLAVRLTASTKAFIFQSRLRNSTIRITLGDVRIWSLEDARTEARLLQMQVDQGKDPRQEKAAHLAELEANKQAQTLAQVTTQDAWNIYVEANKPRWSERHFKDHLKLTHAGGLMKRSRGNSNPASVTKAGPLAGLMPLPLASLNSKQVNAWAAEQTGIRPTSTRLAYAILRAFLNWCIDHPDYGQIVQTNPCTKRIARNTLAKGKTRDDCLQREQLSAWFSAVRDISNPVISIYLQILLLIGARREELMNLKWEDVDFRWKTMRIRDKVEGRRQIPLTPFVQALLLQLPKRNEWVFSSTTSATGRLGDPSIAHRNAVAAAEVGHLTLHGLRRSFATLSEWVDCPAGVVAQIMGHKPSAIAEKHYRRRPLDMLRQWHTKIEQWIVQHSLTETASAHNVLQFKPRTDSM